MNSIKYQRMYTKIKVGKISVSKYSANKKTQQIQIQFSGSSIFLRSGFIWRKFSRSNKRLLFDRYENLGAMNKNRRIT